MVNVKALVAEQLLDTAPKVKGRVLDILVAEEQERRVKAVLKTIKDLDEARRSVQKVKPDSSVFAVDGSVLQVGYTKAKLEELKKANELVAKLEAALEEALSDEKPNFEKVLKHAGNDKSEPAGE